MLDRRALTDHCLSYKDTYEDYPFNQEWTVMRHLETKKTFAYIYERGGRLYINLKCEPLRAQFLRQAHPAVTAAYHMDKAHWNTVLMDGSVGDDALLYMIQHSYELTKPKNNKKKTHL